MGSRAEKSRRSLGGQSTNKCLYTSLRISAGRSKKVSLLGYLDGGKGLERTTGDVVGGAMAISHYGYTLATRQGKETHILDKVRYKGQHTRCGRHDHEMA